ncbi:MAG: transporter associated domain-containing protein, partial [Pseudomonadota bacterium]
KLLAPEDADEIDTLGGLVFTLVNRVPVRGEVVPHESGFEFEVLEADPRRIKRLRILGAKKSTEDVAGTTAAATGEGADIAYAPPETDGPPNSGRA